LKAREIAKELYLSPFTVNTHRKSMIEKLSARNVANLISISFAKGLLKA
jgi:DNA-binding CsgD family transcriptional regulator